MYMGVWLMKQYLQKSLDFTTAKMPRTYQKNII